MIDLKKEREAFEKNFGLPDDTHFLNAVGGSDPTQDSLALKCNWLGWKACAESKQSEIDSLKSELVKAQSVPEKSRYVYLNCNQLKQALEFGAPDLFQENQGDRENIVFQLETEMAIKFMENGHSGSGYYCWYSDLPEEGSILLTEELEAQEDGDGHI